MSTAVQKTTTPKARPAENDLGFGRFFTDHMLTLQYEPKQGWHEPKVVPYGPLPMDPAAGVFHYGQALFEGLKAFRAGDGTVNLFRLDEHCARMARGAPRLCMPVVEPSLMRSLILDFMRVEQDWVPRAPGTSLYLRPTMIATEGFLGVRASQRYTFFIIASPVGAYYAGGVKPVRIWVEREHTRAAKGGLGAVKAGANYAASLLAASRAKEKGYDQVLWLDAEKHDQVEEVGTMNLFALLGDELVTPPLSDSILAGVTRNCVLQLAKGYGLKVSERPLAISELTQSSKSGALKEVFGSGTAAVISPVGELSWTGGSLQVNKGEVGPIAGRLYEEISAIQRGGRPDTHGWLTKI
ncbi:MAG: branched-chain amino acid aminotransferase [Myxococcaceae bacterium]|nr:branched-chain amino acid aminotransferase [Myxococcaceae bacterium]